MPFRKGVYSTLDSGLWLVRLGFVGAEIFTNFVFFGHNFGYRYARKSFKGSKDADFGLVSEEILSHNNGPMGWGQVKVAKNTPTCGLPTENEKNFFRLRLQDLLNP